MQVTPLSPSMGAIITSVDLSDGIAPEQAAELAPLAGLSNNRYSRTGINASHSAGNRTLFWRA